MREIACFVTSHGFGHATRTAAVLEALGRRLHLTPRIFASTGAPLFRQTLRDCFYHHLESDIGFRQSDGFHIDWTATATDLASLLPYSEAVISSAARLCSNCCCVLCDISALGIVVAARLGIPSILIENFTWDWLYTAQQDRHRGLDEYARYLGAIYGVADIHIQTQPVCLPKTSDYRCAPIYRRCRTTAQTVRRQLPGKGRKRVLITMGGLGFAPGFLEELQSQPDYFFIIAGQPRQSRPCENVLMMAQSDPLYHPDLIGGVDIVLFKSGYSTLAECCQAGTPSICIQRRGFAESPVLENYARTHLGAHILSQEDFLAGMWLSVLPHLSLQEHSPATINGADEVAEYLLGRLDL